MGCVTSLVDPVEKTAGADEQAAARDRGGRERVAAVQLVGREMLERPELLTFDRLGSRLPCARHDPDVLSVGDRRWMVR